MAGLFCASLGVMDEQRTTSPSQTFKPEGSLPDWGHSHHLRHAFLPSEHVCTENLTPFYKLLPCKSFSGVATLLNPHKLFDADWHGMSIHVLWKEDVGIQVRLTFQAVLDPIRNSWNNKRGRSCQVWQRVIEVAYRCFGSRLDIEIAVWTSDRPSLSGFFGKSDTGLHSTGSATSLHTTTKQSRRFLRCV